MHILVSSPNDWNSQASCSRSAGVWGDCDTHICTMETHWSIPDMCTVCSMGLGMVYIILFLPQTAKWHLDSYRWTYWAHRTLLGQGITRKRPPLQLHSSGPHGPSSYAQFPAVGNVDVKLLLLTREAEAMTIQKAVGNMPAEWTSIVV